MFRSSCRPAALVLALTWIAASLSAHPMGNFSVNHYARLELDRKGATLTWILDLAELPTLELYQDWKLTQPTKEQVEKKAREQAALWVGNLVIMQDGVRILPLIQVVEAEVSDGAGGLPTLRVGLEADLAVKPGTLTYKDENYANRAGWKEIVIRGDSGVTIEKSSNGAYELSRGLRVYPLDPSIVPPQDLQASVTWSRLAPVTATKPEVPAPPRPEPAAKAPTPAPAVSAPPATTVPAPASSFAKQQPSSPGTVEAGDFLSRMLRRSDLGPQLILFGLLTAFGLGALHALSPGHGKTIVAAYLVGSRGTLKHAMFLGSMVTFTHTLSVFVLGLGVLLFQRYVVPEKIIPILGAISGASIVVIGGILLYRRVQKLSACGHDHTHEHIDELEAAWAREGSRNEEDGMTFLPRRVSTGDFVHTHTHDGSTHSHIIPGDNVSLGSLIALGASGGLVPCPSALILMLSAIALGHTALGLTLLVSFSAGLAIVLMGIGALVLYARNLLPGESTLRQHPAFRFVPVFSAVVVMILGVLMTLTSLGLVQPLRLVS